MTRPTYKTVTRTQGNNRALKEGDVKPETFKFEFEEVPVLPRAFRRMVRTLEFDICEMALTTYICAKEHGIKFTALPIFLVRDFHHKGIIHNIHSDIQVPKDFEGRRVGVQNGYTKTGGVWSRSILQDEYDVDLSKVTWVLSGDEHVTTYEVPGNVVPIGEGNDINDMLASGELAAAVGMTLDHPNVKPVIDNPFEAAVAAMQGRNLYPINHLVVVRDDLLEANPDLAVDIFNTFAASKKIYVDKLKAGEIAEPTAIDKIAIRALETMDDPLPFGIEPSRDVLEQLITHAMTQRIITERPNVDKMFAEPVRKVIA